MLQFKAHKKYQSCVFHTNKKGTDLTYIKQIFLARDYPRLLQPRGERRIMLISRIRRENEVGRTVS